MRDILLARVVDIEDLVSKTTGSDGVDPNMITDPGRAPKVGNLFYNIQVVLLYVISLLIVVSLIYGGFLYITSGGDSEKAERGKRVMTGSIIAIFIVVGSLVIYTFFIKGLVG